MVVRRPSASSRGLPSAGTDAVPQVIVPKLNVDPIWSLKPWPATLVLGREEFEIPAMPAAEWLAYLMQPEPDFEGMILDLLPASEELLYGGQISVEELYDAVLELVALVSARSWWVALRQINIARASWNVLGPMMIEKVDACQISIAAWLDVLIVTILSCMDPKETTLFTLRLEAPPASEKDAVEAPMEAMEMDRGSFLSMN